MLLFFVEKKRENDSDIFPTNNNSIFDNVVGIYLTSCHLNDVVRLTML